MLRRSLGLLLILLGLLAVTWVAFEYGAMARYDREARAALERVRELPSSEPESPSSEPESMPDTLPVGEPIGTLEIVRVGLSGVVVEGDSDAVLGRAIGHLPDTPLPWNDGNSALAAHRDTIFRPLKGVRLGDLLRLKTPHGDFDYRVKETMIVKPEDVWVLDPTSNSTLTLISCWPFNYIGHAPERFIVRAERIPTVNVAAHRTE